MDTEQTPEPQSPPAGMLPAELVARVKAAADLVTVAGARTALRATGSGWKGLCPFHADRTPSFSIVASGRTFRCFGCGRHGDVIAFVMAAEKLTFREAVLALAARFEVSAHGP